MRINVENQKIVKAITTQNPTFSLADFIDHERDHERQVSRLTGKQPMYGFPADETASNHSGATHRSRKSYDPEIIRPVPKKFNPLDGKKRENKAKLDDILDDGANKLIENSPRKSESEQNKSSESESEQNKNNESESEQNKNNESESEQNKNNESENVESKQSENNDDNNGKLDDVVDDGVNGLLGEKK